jgi:hypothetical protein
LFEGSVLGLESCPIASSHGHCTRMSSLASPAGEHGLYTRLKAINSRGGRSSWSLPLSNLYALQAEENGTQEHNVPFRLAALSLFGATLAWSVDHAVFTSVFAALGTVAVLGAAAPRRRRRKREAEDWGRGEAAVTDGHKHLAQANYHIAQAEKHIAQQKKLIEKLERNGARDIDVAVSMLRALEVALRAFERHRGLIMKRLQDGE